MKRIFVIVFLAALPLFSQAVNWDVDKAHSKIGFTVKHLVITDVDGFFNKYDAKITTEGEDFTKGKVELNIDASSVNTDNQKRDDHLRSADFFDVGKYPKIKFVSKSIKSISKYKYKISGLFTMKDVTKSITLDADFSGVIKDPWGGTRAAFKITGKINRSDYNVTTSSIGDNVVGNEVKFNINVELLKSK